MPTTGPAATKPKNAPFKVTFEAARWVVLAALALAFIFIARRSPEPSIPPDAGAAPRVAPTLNAAGDATPNGKPQQAQLDNTDLNSLMQSAAATQSEPQPSSTDSLPAGAANASPDSAASAAAASSGATPGLNADTDETLAQVQSNVKDFKMDMVGDLAKAYVTYDYHGKDVAIEIDGHLSAQDGYLKFDPVAGNVGGVPMPQSVLQVAVEKLMSSPEAREKLRLPDGVSDIHIVDGQPVITYKPDASPQPQQ
jgi:hypothetical protein